MSIFPITGLVPLWLRPCSRGVVSHQAIDVILCCFLVAFFCFWRRQYIFTIIQDQIEYDNKSFKKPCQPSPSAGYVPGTDPQYRPQYKLRSAHARVHLEVRRRVHRLGGYTVMAAPSSVDKLLLFFLFAESTLGA